MYNMEKVILMGEQIDLTHFSEFNIVGVIGSAMEQSVVEKYSREYLLQMPADIWLIVDDDAWDFTALCDCYRSMERLGLELGKNYMFYSMMQLIDTNKIYKLCATFNKNFPDLMDTIICGRSFVVFWGNCQMHAVANLIINNTEFNQNFITCKVPRFWLTDEKEIAEAKIFMESKILRRADYLFTQNVGGSNKYGYINSTEFIVSQLADRCRIFKVTKLYFTGYFPQLLKYTRAYDLQKSTGLRFDNWIDKEVLTLLIEGKTPEEIAEIVSAKDFYTREAVRTGINEKIDEFAKREAEDEVDIKMADYLYDNYDKFLMFATENHPTKKVMLELSRRILKMLKISNTIIKCEGDTEICYPCPPKMYHLVYPSVLKALGLEELKREYYCSISLAEDDIRNLKPEIINRIKSENHEKYHFSSYMKFDEYILLYARILSTLICVAL